MYILIHEQTKKCKLVRLLLNKYIKVNITIENLTFSNDLNVRTYYMYLENINNQHSTHLDNLDCTQWSKTLVLSTSLPSRFVTTLKATSFNIHTVTIIVVFIVMYNHLHGCIINYWFLYMIRTVQDFYKQNAVFINHSWILSLYVTYSVL